VRRVIEIKFNSGHTVLFEFCLIDEIVVATHEIFEVFKVNVVVCRFIESINSQ
jgi:hypothetical protein